MRLLPLTFAMAIAAAPAFALAADAVDYTDPAAVVEALYAPYIANELPGDWPYELFAPSLQALFEEDEANTPDGEMGAIEFDPFINGQDFVITDVDVEEVATGPDEALVEARFVNFNTPIVLHYAMERQDDGRWLIADVESRDGEYPYALSEIFAEAAASR